MFSWYKRHLVSPSLGQKFHPTCYFKRERDLSLPLSEPFFQVPFGKHMVIMQESSCPDSLQSNLPATYSYECFDLIIHFRVLSSLEKNTSFKIMFNQHKGMLYLFLR